MAQYATLNGTATTSPQTFSAKCNSIVYISNDDETNILYVSFAGDVADKYIAVLPAEKLTCFPEGLDVFTLTYKSAASTVNFRFLGLRN